MYVVLAMLSRIFNLLIFYPRSCMTCGNIVSDTILSADIEFGEGGGGAAFVQGSFVADNASECHRLF